MSKSKKSFIISWVLVVILSGVARLSFQTAPVNGLAVTFIDVGQGDAILLQTPQGENILIDSGEDEVFQHKLMKVLALRGVDTIDALVATHYHSDHMGAMKNVFDNFEVKCLIIPDYEPNNKAKARLIEAAKKENSQIYEISEGSAFPHLSSDLIVSVLHPQKGGFSDNENDNSLVLMAEYFETTLLLMGDTEEDGEKEIVQKYDIETDILKVAHHGSTTSTCKEFLAAADPTYAVVQCGNGNPYGHPHSETIAALEDDDVRIYRTDRDGSVTFLISEKGIEEIKTSQR